MTIRLLRTLIAISETGSFAAAAERVCVTQSAVSQQMKRLEEIAGVPLFDRNHRIPQLSASALEMLPAARELVASHDQMIARARGERLLDGELNIGSTSSTLASLVPLALKRLYRTAPAIRTRIVPKLSDQLLLLVERGAIDAAVMSDPPPSRRQLFHSGLNWMPVAREQLAVVCSTAIATDDPHQVIREQPLISLSASAWISELVAAAIRHHRLTPAYTMELDSLESVVTVVSHGLGAAIVPLPCIPETRGGRLKYLPLEPDSLSREIGVLERTGNAKRHLIAKLHAALVETVEEARKPH
ncbi:MAG: LysR substrate-binding domain-containing protein [Rhizobiaceae bacterium]